MINRFHGIDMHKYFWTITVLDIEGKLIKKERHCYEITKYIESLNENDSVVLEASNGSFYWADKVERQGAVCYIMNPYRFKIIRDSWKKSDKNDSMNLSKALWIHHITNEFKMPTVHKPSSVIRELRKLFTYYDIINKQIRMFKNSIQSILSDNGVVLTSEQKNWLFSIKGNIDLLSKLDISPASKYLIEDSLDLLLPLLLKKRQVIKKIIITGKPFESQIELLISIRGINPFMALAFLSDVADITRFKSARKMNSYLGLVPGIKESAGKVYLGHILKESRKRTRTLFTQSIVHFCTNSDYLNLYYHNLKDKKGAGKSRIALIRKICSIMRSMLKNNEPFRNVDKSFYEKKKKEFRNMLRKST